MKALLFAVSVLMGFGACMPALAGERSTVATPPPRVRVFRTRRREDAEAAALAAAEKFGGEAYRIADTGSMEPTLTRNSLVVVIPVKPDDVIVSDIVTFRRGDDIVTHRVNHIVGDGVWRTKGDANKITDAAPLRESQLIGRVSLIFHHD